MKKTLKLGFGRRPYNISIFLSIFLLVRLKASCIPKISFLGALEVGLFGGAVIVVVTGHPVAQGLLNILVFWPCVKPVTHFGGFVWRRTAMVECVTGFWCISPYFCQKYWTCYIFLARINLPCCSTFTNLNQNRKVSRSLNVKTLGIGLFSLFMHCWDTKNWLHIPPWLSSSIPILQNE